MAVSRIDNHRVGTGMHQHIDAVQRIRFHANGRRHQQTAHGILRRNGVILDFHQVFIGNKTYQEAVLIYDGELLHLAAHKDLRRLGQ